MAELHRIPVMQGDVPEKAGNLQLCQWCAKALKPEDTVWLCFGNIGKYLVCDDCHEKAIIHPRTSWHLKYYHPEIAKEMTNQARHLKTRLNQPEVK